MPSKGSAYRAEGNQTLRTVCTHCGASIPTEVGHAHPLDQDVRRETWGLVGYQVGVKTVFATCAACHDTGWRPPEFVPVN
jgi:5-methylcytosine-specific restriction endonuclease McrA